MVESRIRTLVLYARYTTHLSYFDDWLDAFRQAPEFEVKALNICERKSARALNRIIHNYELIILLHSTNGDTLAYIDHYRTFLKLRRGKLLSFVGNEISLPNAPLAPKLAFLRDVGVDFIATQLPLEAGKWLYATCSGSRILAVPHALNPHRYRPMIGQADRPIDIGTRSSPYNVFVGDDERNRIIDFFKNHRFDPPINVDISTGHRFNRNGWAVFLNRCKGTIATEAGTWYLEPDDRTMQAVRDYLGKRQDPRLLVKADSPLRRLGHHLPATVRKAIWYIGHGLLTDENTLQTPGDYADVYHNVLRYQDRAPVYGKCISSRHFDAIGTQTAQILFRGRYNDILRADEHYIPLAKNFSDIDEAMRKFCDLTFREAMVRQTYDYVMDQHTYRHRTAQVAKLVGE